MFFIGIGSLLIIRFTAFIRSVDVTVGIGKSRHGTDASVHIGILTVSVNGIIAAARSKHGSHRRDNGDGYDDIFNISHAFSFRWYCGFAIPQIQVITTQCIIAQITSELFSDHGFILRKAQKITSQPQPLGNAPPITASLRVYCNIAGYFIFEFIDTQYMVLYNNYSIRTFTDICGFAEYLSVFLSFIEFFIRHGETLKMLKNKTFKRIYLIFCGILILIIAFCLIHVASVLKEYESCQPENIAVGYIETLQKATKNGTLSELIRSSCSEEELPQLLSVTEDKLAMANGELSARLTENSDGGEKLTYTVFSDQHRIIDVVLSAKGSRTKLALFPITEWDILSVTPASYSHSLSLPASMSVLRNGEPVEGSLPGVNGKKSYSVVSYEDPMLTLRDSVGNELFYDGEAVPDITEYVVRIPSNYGISSSDGTYVLDVSSAVTEDIDDYKYVSQYTEMPKKATYYLGLFDSSDSFIITDNLGSKVDFSIDGHSVTIDGQASSPEIPSEVYSKDKVLDNAKKWSLFMTADLTGTKHGFGQVEKFLLPNSYLSDVALKWATGVDITFTSVHTLDNPPFSEETVSDYIRYSDSCFSVDVKLTKTMHLNSGADVADTMDCRFYYVLENGTWYVCDIQEIIK